MKSITSCRLAGCLTSPCNSANLGVGDILQGQLLAYGVGSSVNIVDLLTFKILCTLQGGHEKIPVTALAWCASGDGEGNIVVWDVTRLIVQFKLLDQKRIFENTEGVRSLAWVMHEPSLLAVVLGPSTLVLWEAKYHGAPLWYRDLAGVGSLHSLCVDPLDRRSICLCGSHGVCLLVSFTIPYEKTNVMQYRVTSSGSSSQKTPSNIYCLFPSTENTLLVMLSSEILIFDVEFGQPLGAITLPNDMKPFKKLIGVHGYTISYGAGHHGGMDTIYALHEDGALSVWNRTPETLSYSLHLTSKLIPKPLRGMHGSQLYSMISCGCIWWDLNTSQESAQTHFPERKLFIFNIMTNGQLWKWSLTLTPSSSPSMLPDLITLDTDNSSTTPLATAAEAPLDSFQPRPLADCIETPVLETILSTLSGSANKISVLPICLRNAWMTKPSSEAQIPILAASTSTGSMDIFTLQRGCLSSVHLEMLKVYALHETRCRSVRWLGHTPFIVSFTNERVDGGWKNSILLVDVRCGEVAPFRAMELEDFAVLGVRTSPSGKYILVILKDAPSEVWMVSGLKEVKRIFHVESNFTAVEWAYPELEPHSESSSTHTW